MAVSVTTTRYAKALFSVADRRNERERVGEELAALARLFGESPELVATLRNPRVPGPVKRRILEASGLQGACDTLRDFVALCLDRNRADVLLEANEEFARLEREARGVVRCRVESAEPLDDDARASVQAKLEEFTGKSVEIEASVDPDLIGGLRVLIGTRMYDGSVRRQLDDLALHLQSTRIE